MKIYDTFDKAKADAKLLMQCKDTILVESVRHPDGWWLKHTYNRPVYQNGALVGHEKVTKAVA